MIGSERQHIETHSSNAESAQSSVSEHIAIRPFQNGDERKIVTLLGFPVSHDVALEHWRWKLMHWPSKAANVWMAAVDDYAVFHYGGIPLRFCLDGSSATAMISVDAMTAPEFRRRGLLTRGTSLAFKDWKAGGIAFTLGLPNERWGSRIVAAGWQNLFPLQWLVRPLRPEALAARRFGMPWLRRATCISDMWRRLLRNRLYKDPRIEFQKITQSDRSFDQLWDECRSDAMFSTVRDSAWVQWRFLSSPTRKYDVVMARRGDDAVGYYASRISRTPEKTSAFLAEMVGRNNDTAVHDSLLDHAIVSSYDAGANLLAALAVPGTISYKLLRRAGFLRGPAFDVHIVPFATNLSMDDLIKPQNWNLSGADFDVV